MWFGLLLGVCLCLPQAGDDPSGRKAVHDNREVTLTETRRTHRVEVPVSVRSLPFVEVPITQISNPQQAGFSILASLESDGSEGASRKATLGSFTPYPPDRPGKFILRASSAMEKLARMGVDLKKDPVVLTLELKFIAPGKPVPLGVTLATARWLSQP